MSASLPVFPWDTLADVTAAARAHEGGMVDLSVGTPVDDVAPGFRATARCPDGVIEAIESTTDWLAFGTQFHPEANSASALDLRIFEEFIGGITGEVPAMKLVA